jgi:glycosyltransferase involved in cell wall biosynthesis
MPNAVGTGHPLSLNKISYQFACRYFRITVLANSIFTGRSIGSLLVRPQLFYLSADAKLFQPSRDACVARKAMGLGPDAILMGAISRLDRSKGHDIVIAAMKRQIDQGHDVHLIIVGGPTAGAYWDELQAIARLNGVSDRVHYKGETKTPELYYVLFDLFLQTRKDAEPFGLSTVEAMMSGVPVIAHALGGPAETVVDNETGWHFAPATIDALSNAISRAIQDRAKWKKMGIQARAHAVANFSIEAQGSRYEKILSELLTPK